MKMLINLMCLTLITGFSYGQQKDRKIKIRKSYIGLTMQEAIVTFNLDTLTSDKLEEPPGVIRGIRSQLPDSTIIYLQIKRKESVNGAEQSFESLFNEKIIGIGIAYVNCKTKKVGSGFAWWELNNPYCDK